jgi:acetyl-CoA carboxylase carboxyltransferase component
MLKWRHIMAQIDEKIYGQSKTKLESIFDAGTFVELGAYTKRSGSESDFEGVLCGYGAVNGELAFAFVQDSGRTKGAFGERHAKKIANLYALAVKNGAPVIGVFDSAGAVIYDGAAALAAYGKFMKCVSDASGVIPQIAIIDGVCGGSSAVVASMFDLTITIKDTSKLFVNSPFVIGKEAGSADFAAQNGLSAYNAKDEAEAFAYARKLVALLPANNASGAFAENGDDMNRAVAVDAESYKADELVATLADNCAFTRVYADYAKNVVLGFASFGGITAGVVASNPENKGIVDIKSARAIAKLVSFCDSFALPVLTLVDSEGLDVSLEAEGAAYASELAKLAYAYTSSSNAKLTVVVGKAYGAAFTLLGSKSVGADMALALPTACISVLSPEASVAFVWNSKVGEQSREELEKEWKEKCASAAEACDCGEIDDIIEPAELRARVCAALSMLASKAEGAPTRRHANMPL